MPINNVIEKQRCPRVVDSTYSISDVFALPGQMLESDHNGIGTIEFRRIFDRIDFAGHVDFADATIVKPHSSIGEHLHQNSLEIYFIVDGHPKVIVNGKEFRLHPKGVSVVHPGGRHTLINDTNEEVSLFVVQVPASRRNHVEIDDNRFVMHFFSEGDYGVINTRRPIFDPSSPELAAEIGADPVFLVLDRRINASHRLQMDDYFRMHKIAVVGAFEHTGAESDKTLQDLHRLLRILSEKELPRSGVILAVGGGVTLDFGGCAAAHYYRGVQFVRVPTTLIGIVDVAVGIKQAVNELGHKNRVGSFYPAKANICDRSFLSTLSANALAGGFAEIIKIAIICDPTLFELVEHHCTYLISSGFQQPATVADEVIARAQLGMMRELAENLFESDKQRKVDFGHTFSPVIEACSGYTLLHGLAVGIDVLLSTHIAVGRGMCASEVLSRLVAVYQTVGLPLTQDYCSVDCLVGALEAARRHRGALNLIMPVDIGTVYAIQSIERAELADAVDYFKQFAARTERL